MSCRACGHPIEVGTYLPYRHVEHSGPTPHYARPSRASGALPPVLVPPRRAGRAEGSAGLREQPRAIEDGAQ